MFDDGGALAGPDGNAVQLERELMAKHSALYSAHAELERLVGELRRTQQALEERNQEVAAMAGQVSQFGWRAAVGEMCATIAHNLNNPVAALLSTLRTVDQRLLGPIDLPEMTRLVARARASAARVEEHVAAVVNVHRVGSLSVAPCALDLAKELDTALSLAANRLKAVEVRRGYHGPLTASVPQDPFHHVLANVLDNAVRAMPDGGTLDIDVRRRDAAWVVAVVDSGGGLDQLGVAQARGRLGHHAHHAVDHLQHRRHVVQQRRRQRADRGVAHQLVHARAHRPDRGLRARGDDPGPPGHRRLHAALPRRGGQLPPRPAHRLVLHHLGRARRADVSGARAGGPAAVAWSRRAGDPGTIVRRGDT